MAKFGLIGYPLSHSFSRKFFTGKFKNEGIDAEYQNFEISDISLFPQVIKDNPDLVGLNVTIPYKTQIIPYLNEVDAEANEIGAVNVVKIDRMDDGSVKLIGYNSDIIGFQNSIAPLIEKKIHKKALILGTGGASKAVVKALNNLGIVAKYVSRSRENNVLAYNELDKNVLKEYTVVINTSPVGTFPKIDEAPLIPYGCLTENHLLYDLVYNPEDTKFLRLGKLNGAKVKNGYEMLVLQALASWDIWNK